MVYRDPRDRKVRGQRILILDDSLGRWVIHDTRDDHRRGVCSACSNQTALVVRPHKPLALPEGIEIGDTILSRGTNLGLTCGCYAKLHRQVAHIQDAMKRSRKEKV